MCNVERREQLTIRPEGGWALTIPIATALLDTSF